MKGHLYDEILLTELVAQQECLRNWLDVDLNEICKEIWAFSRDSHICSEAANGQRMCRVVFLKQMAVGTQH